MADFAGIFAEDTLSDPSDRRRAGTELILGDIAGEDRLVIFLRVMPVSNFIPTASKSTCQAAEHQAPKRRMATSARRRSTRS